MTRRSDEMMSGQIGSEMRHRTTPDEQRASRGRDDDRNERLGLVGRLMSNEDYAGYLRGLIIESAANGYRVSEIQNLLNRLRVKEQLVWEKKQNS